MTQPGKWQLLSRWFLRLRVPLLLAIVAAVVWYIRSQPVAVEAHRVQPGTVIRSVMGTGTLEARIRTTISPKISGRIAEVLVDQGSLVKAGQLLVRLDDEDLAQQVRIATAGISTSEATLGRFQAEIAQAKSTFAKTEADLGRTQKLVDANTISQSEFDQTQEAFELAKSGLLKAEANLLEAEQQVTLNRETLKYQQARLADTQLLAPFDGLVIERQRDAGAIVVPGSPILQLISLDELWISAWVDETEMDQLKDQQPANIVFRSQPSTAYEGLVARLGKQTDRETREFTVDIRVLKLPETWAIGQRAEVFIETARAENCLSVPSSFMTKQGGEVGVYVHEAGVAKWRPLSLGLEGRNAMEVRGGLESGEQVIKPSLAPTAVVQRQKGAVAMNLAFKDIRKNLGRFVLTTLGIGMLLMIVMGMAGIYRGLLEDATFLIHKIGADLWIVQQDTRGPFAELSRVPASMVYRVQAVPGVSSAKEFVFHTIQREHRGALLRMSILGLSWPEDKGDWLQLSAGARCARITTR